MKCSEVYRLSVKNALLVENNFAYTPQHVLLQSERIGDKKTLKLKAVR